MPDTTLPPGNSAVMRDTNRRSSGRGAAVLRRTSAGEATPAEPGRLRAPNGAVARAERVEPRWRDIQWIDFTSDPASAALPEPEPTPAPPLPTAARPGDMLRHFAKPSAASSGAKSYAIPGLATRFTRLEVPRSPVPPLPTPPPGIARLMATPKPRSVLLHPRTPALLAAAAEPPPAVAIASPEPVPPPAVVAATPEPGPSPPLPAPEPERPREALPVAASAPRRSVLDEEDGRPIPASFLTPTSTAPTPEPAVPLGATLAAKLVRARTTLRGQSDVAAAALNSGFVRAGAALRRKPSPQTGETRPGPVAPPPSDDRPAEAAAVAPEPEPIPPPRSFSPGWLAGAIGKLTGRIVKAENRLRLSGTIALAVILIAVVAYSGGALLTALAGAGTDTEARAKSDQTVRTVQTAALASPSAPAAAPAPNVPPKDPAARAAFYLAQAKTGDATAQYDVGVLYARGEGLVQDYASAASWFHLAAAQGDVAAEYNLGVLYERGLGVAADQTEALNWYRSAADQNHAGAQFNLALAYAEGRGAKQDFATAARWYQRAAQQGLAPAMVNLAILYERGEGLDRSPVDAYAWYSAAGERGDAGAKARAVVLFQQFNDKDKARAQGLAATIAAALDASAPPA